MTITFKVEYYQINCGGDGIGEAAIILLIKIDSTKTSPNDKTVDKAVLLDAGFKDGARDNIYKTIIEIGTAFGLKYLQFDAVVMTHWDRDHYYGFSNSWFKSILFHEKLPWKDKQWCCFKYDKTTKQPLTTFYCPMEARKGKTWANIGYSTGKFGGKTFATIDVDVPEFPLAATTKDVVYEEAENAMLYGGDYTKMLTANIFNDGKQTPDYKATKTVATLVTDNNPWDTSVTPPLEKPGLYIVGVDQKYVSQSGLTVVDVSKGTKDKTNPSSVLLLLVWKEDTANTKRHITLYAGGDAEYMQENNLIDFLGGAQITTIKAGHHGSRAGTSMKFITAVQPIHYLVGNGTANGHPDPCVVWYLDCYWTKKFGKADTTKRIHSTCFPYYLGISTDDPSSPDPTETSFINTEYVYVKAFAATKKYYTKKELTQLEWADTYRKAIHDTFYPTGIDPADELLEEVDDLSNKQAQKQWILANVWDKFLKWSDCEYNFYPLNESMKKRMHDDSETEWGIEEVQYVRLTMTGSDPLKAGWEYKTGSGIFSMTSGTPTYTNSSTNTLTTVVQEMELSSASLSAALLTTTTDVDNPPSKRRRRDGFYLGYNFKYPPSRYSFRMSKIQAAELVAAEQYGEDPQATITEGTGFIFTPPPGGASVQPSLAIAPEPAPSSTPASTTVLAAAAAVAPKTYILPSWAPVPSGSTEADLLRISDATDEGMNMSDFLAGLHNGYLALDTHNELDWSDRGAPYAFQVKLRYGTRIDDFQGWIGSFFNHDLAADLARDGKTSGLVATMKIYGDYSSPNGAGLYAFRLEVTQIFSSGWQIVFNSEPVVLTRTVDTTSAFWSVSQDTLDGHGLFKKHSGLFMCVGSANNGSTDNGQTNSITLTNLFTLAGLEDLIPSWLTTLLGLLKLNPTFKMHWDYPLTTDKVPEPMNGIWFDPDNNYETILQLWWIETVATEVSNLAPIIQKILPGVIVGDCRVVIKKRAQYHKVAVDEGNGSSTVTPFMTKTGTLCIQTSISFSDTSQFKWDIYVGLSETGADVILRWDPKSPKGDTSVDSTSGLTGGFTELLGYVFTQIKKITGFDSTTDDTTITNIVKSFKTIGSSPITPRIREASISLEAVPNNQGGHDHHVRSFVMRFESDVPWGVQTSGARVPLQLSFEWSNGGISTDTSLFKFDARLWRSGSPGNDALNSMFDPHALPYPELISVADGSYTFQSYFAIEHLPGFPSGLNLPAGVPKYITSLSLDISNQDVRFSGTMTSTPAPSGNFLPTAPPPAHAPGLSLESVTLSAGYTYSPSALSIGFGGVIWLTPLDPTIYTTEKLTLDLQYVKYSTGSLWYLRGYMDALNMASLATLFPHTDSTAVMTILNDITLENLLVEYTHDSLGNGGTLSASGDLVLSLFNLAFSFINSPTSWKVTASLAPDFTMFTNQLKFGTLLEDLTSGDLSQSLPDYVQNILFTVPTNSKLDVLCEKLTTGETLYSLDAILGDLEFTFVQLVTTATPPLKKTILKFTIDGLPSITSVPFLDIFTQPFDQLDFLWTDANLTKAEVTLINDQVFRNSIHSEIISSAPKTTAPVTDATVVVSKGSHFTVVVEENATPTPLVDYGFGDQTTTPPADDGNSTGGGASDNGNGVQGVQDIPPAPTNANGTATVAWSKTIGPLTISALSLTFKDGRLHLIFTAGMKLGPLAGTVKGLDISIPVFTKLKFAFEDIQVSIDGLGLEMNSPPVIIAGILMELGDSLYAGGITIEVEPYTFLAGGEYGVVTKNGSSLKTLFVFAELAGPLVELEIASISGITGGFGYNSALTLPTAQNVTTFPFIQGTGGAGSDPLTVLNSFINAPVPWFAPEKGPFWIAAGMDVEACEILNIHAVVVLDINSDVILGVFADCTASIPANAPTGSQFACVDLGLVAVMDFGKGTFYAEGQLTPKSFILDPACHLTGGFALCSWFKNSGHDGDWVFTIGGYHPAFQVPSWYPTPPRLGISWQFDSHVNISGQAYFAITPKVCMGGCELKLTFTSGSLSAHLDAWADFLINYKPFYFQADIGVDIGVSYSLHIGCIHKKFNVDFNASLNLHGPPIAGHAHVDWKIISFDIYFGNSSPNNNPLSWSDFLTFIQSSPTDSTTGSAEGPQPIYSINATKGLVTDQSATYNANNEMRTASISGWMVDPTMFILQASSLIPFASATINSKSLTFDQGSQYPTYIKPMHLGTAITSSVVITVTQKSNGAQVTNPIISQVVSQAPTAIWGQYTTSNEPSNSAAKAALLKTDNLTQPQLTGIQLDFTLPTEKNDYIQFDVSDSLYTSIKATEATEVPFSLQQSWTASKAKWKPAFTTARNGFKALWEGCTGNSPATLSAWQYFSGAGDDTQPLSIRQKAAFADCHNIPTSVTKNLNVNYTALPTFAAEAINW